MDVVRNKVESWNRMIKDASQFVTAVQPIFQKYVGKKVKNNDGSLYRPLRKELDEVIDGLNFEFRPFVRASYLRVELTIKSMYYVGKHTVNYLDITDTLCDLDGAGYLLLVVENPLKDYQTIDIQQYEALLEMIRLKEKKIEELKAEINDIKFNRGFVGLF